MFISAPTNFDFNIPNRLKNKIHDTYGNLNLVNEDIITRYTRPAVSVEKLKRYIEYSHSLGIKFDYIINRPGLNPDRQTVALLDSLCKIKVDIITVSNPELISFIKKEYPFYICSSVYCKINSFEKALEYAERGCDTICLDYSKNNDLDFIKLLKSRLNVKIKFIANNICLPDCPYQKEHFNGKGYLEKASLKCLRLKLNDISLIRKTGFVFPADLDKYEEAGVDYIKLGGRNKPTRWIINCVMSYSKRRYAGNCFRLMNTTGSENRSRFLIKYLLPFLPNSFLKLNFRILHMVTNKELFQLISKEKNIKSLLRIYSADDYFYLDHDKLLVSDKKRAYILKEVEKILSDSN